MFMMPQRTSALDAVLSFTHAPLCERLEPAVIHAARRSLLDLTGVAIAGSTTKLSHLIRQHAVMHFAAGDPRHGATGARLLFDGRPVSAVGAALAGGMTIDSVDAHDGHKLTKGHVGCGVFPALLAMTEQTPELTLGEFLNSLVIGYEIGVRAGVALHDTACDYHTSGAWVSVAVSAVAARLLALSPAVTREALGIAEYHGPRSQMMRCIDHPTMLKDGSGWGSMAGVSAALLARDGFTGAPALTIENESVAHLWTDLGSHWRMTEQYLKPYPVCRWAQPAVVAALKLVDVHGLDYRLITRITITTFHESKRLATPAPVTTEQAQYSLPFPVAIALVFGSVEVSHIDGAGLHDKDVLRLSHCIRIEESDEYNRAFPAKRFSAVSVTLNDGRQFDSGTVEADGDPEAPLSDAVVYEKFDRYAAMGLSQADRQKLKSAIIDSDLSAPVSLLTDQLYTCIPSVQ